jgi:hypothetical protein
MGILWKDLRIYMWKDIPGFEGKYQISDDGEVKSLRRWVPNGTPNGMWLRERILRQQPMQNGYLQVSLRDGTKTYVKYVHIIVAEAFLQKPSPKHIVNHKDGNKRNCKVSNLEYVTFSENNQHAYDTKLHGKQKRRLTPEQVLQIRAEYPTLSRRELAAKYNISKNAIDYIVTYKTWKDLK